MTKKFRGDHTRYGQTSNMSEQETQAARAGRGGGFSGTRSKRTKRRQEFLAEQETHAMEAAKPLEVVSDGDLSEVKKDPEETKKSWEVWLEKKEKEKEEPKKDEDEEPNEFEEAVEEVKEQGETVVGGTALNNALSLIGLSYKSWLDNVTKPIPDSKGGRGSFQHCINANKDKKNPGGWCKQIERKIGKGKDEGEEEEVKISTYKKLTRIKDRLQAHKKKGLGALGRGKLNPYTGKKTKLGKLKEQYKLEDFESEKKIDEKARKKRESKEAAIPFNPKSESTDTWNCDLCNIEIPNDSDADKRKKRHADFHVDETDKPEGRHRNWTFGNAKFTLGKEKAWEIWLEKTLQSDMEKEEPLGSLETDAEILSGMKRPYKTRPGSSALTERQVGEPGKLRRAIHHPKIGHKDKLREIWEKKHPTHLLGGEYGTKRTGGKSKKEIERKEYVEANKPRYSATDERFQGDRNQKIHEGMDALKTDYFVEEIRANIIYHNKIFPLIGMIAGSVARGAVSDGAKKVGGELLDGMGDMAKESEEE